MKRRFLIILLTFCWGSLFAEESRISLLFTGDLHSRFEEHLDPFHLGGAARLKTAIDQRSRLLSEQKIPVLRLDAGDCLEGGIYFNVGGGAFSYKMLSLIGYDAAVLGNHDWYNGPDHLDHLLGEVSPGFSLLSANLNFRKIPDHGLKKKIKPYEIFYRIGDRFVRKTKNDSDYSDEEKNAFKKAFKVGVFGLSTNEPFYEFLFGKVQILNPLGQARKTVSELRREGVDLIVLLSHLLDETDVSIAEQVPHIDVILGGHTHNRVVPRDRKPIAVEWEDEEGKYTTWIAKSGEFGQFLGEIQLVFDTSRREKKIVWDQSSYDLHQIDERYEEDIPIKEEITRAKELLIEKYQKKENCGFDIFSDEVAESEINLVKSPASESYFGNLIANAIYEKTKSVGVHFSVNNTEFLSHGLFKGKIRSIDVFQAFPVIFNPSEDRSWTIWTFEMDGKALRVAVNAAFGLLKQFFDISHLQITYDLETPLENKIVSLKVDGEEVTDDRVYKVAASEGIVQALLRMKEAVPEIAISNVENTGIEIWLSIREYMKNHSPLRASDPDIRVSGRMRTVQPDLAILSEDIVVKKVDISDKSEQRFVEISEIVSNHGYSYRTEPAKIHFYYDHTPNTLVDFIDPFKPRNLLFPRQYKRWNPLLEDLPDDLRLIGSVDVRPLAKDESEVVSLKWDVTALEKSAYPYIVYVLLDRASGALNGQKVEESNLYNNKAYTFIYLN